MFSPNTLVQYIVPHVAGLPLGAPGRRPSRDYSTSRRGEGRFLAAEVQVQHGEQCKNVFFLGGCSDQDELA